MSPDAAAATQRRSDAIAFIFTSHHAATPSIHGMNVHNSSFILTKKCLLLACRSKYTPRRRCCCDAAVLLARYFPFASLHLFFIICFYILSFPPAQRSTEATPTTAAAAAAAHDLSCYYYTHFVIINVPGDGIIHLDAVIIIIADYFVVMQCSPKAAS